MKKYKNEVDERPWGKYEVLLIMLKLNVLLLILVKDYHTNIIINEKNNGL